METNAGQRKWRQKHISAKSAAGRMALSRGKISSRKATIPPKALLHWWRWTGIHKSIGHHAGGDEADSTAQPNIKDKEASNLPQRNNVSLSKPDCQKRTLKEQKRLAQDESKRTCRRTVSKDREDEQEDDSLSPPLTDEGTDEQTRGQTLRPHLERPRTRSTFDVRRTIRDRLCCICSLRRETWMFKV